jgi:hypothetical protein
MSDAETEKRLANMMIHAEAEKALRQCRAYIERLRREKKLGYTSSPAASIDEKYLEIYVARAKQRRVSRTIKPKRGDGSVAPKEEHRMVPANAVPGPFNLLTIAEIASKSGRTTKQIRRLCLHGLVPYLPGEPRLIDEIDVTEHFERRRVAKLAKIPGTPEFEASQLREILEQKRRKARRARILRELEPVFERIQAQIAAGTYRPGGAQKK